MKITATESAIEMIKRLKKEYGELLFEQSAGCCDGTAPICVQKEGHYLSSQLEKVGEIEGVPYYIEKKQLEYLKYMNQEIDCKEGYGATFSLESAKGYAFIINTTVEKKEQ